MMRAGYIGSAAALVLLTTIVCLTTVLAGWASQQELELSHRLQRVQGREWCLGAEALPRGASLGAGHWRVLRLRDGSVRATGPAGTYSIDAHGSERWTTAQGGGR